MSNGLNLKVRSSCDAPMQMQRCRKHGLMGEHERDKRAEICKTAHWDISSACLNHWLIAGTGNVAAVIGILRKMNVVSHILGKRMQIYVLQKCSYSWKITPIYILEYLHLLHNATSQTMIYGCIWCHLQPISRICYCIKMLLYDK